MNFATVEPYSAQLSPSPGRGMASVPPARDYARLEKVGQGTFGQVFRAKARATGEEVALKYVRLRHVEDGLPISALRELLALRHVQHPHVLRLIDAFAQGSSLVLVLEYASMDLARLLDAVGVMPESHAKCMTLMLLHGLHACHDLGIIHRVRERARGARVAPRPALIHALACPRGSFTVPRGHASETASRCGTTFYSAAWRMMAPSTHGETIRSAPEQPTPRTACSPCGKPLSPSLRGLHPAFPTAQDLKLSNLLITAEGLLKIGDFGQARLHQNGKAPQDKDDPYSHQVSTRWYRAPELLFGARHYGTGVDMWAVGCILAQLITGWPLFPGAGDIEQIFTVAAVLGSPNEEVWPGISQLPDYGKLRYPDDPGVPLSTACPTASPEAIEFLGKLITYPPGDRLSASEALAHPFFFLHPLPSDPEEVYSQARVSLSDGAEGAGPSPVGPGPPHAADEASASDGPTMELTVAELSLQPLEPRRETTNPLLSL